jgi:hypothetical protein
MNADQEWRCDDKIATPPQHRIYVSTRPHRPGQMLKHLIRNDQIELTIDYLGTYVEIGKISGGI